ncbi:hypothetical protein ACH9EU_14105 [Kocuria sp. M1R5S2]|uniref:AMIN-like domain-containing (lipo)protein n=1 Tax=Kocuria rhizosphaerae TaxID=3376285 RepID=UPI0037A65653
MKKLLSWLAALVLATGSSLFVPAAVATGPTPYCGIVWGSLEKAEDTYTAGAVTNVRSGRHECFDRLVVDLDGDVAGYSVRYVPSVHQDGSGNLVPLRGGAFLSVVVNAPSYDEDGNATYTPADQEELVYVTGYDTFRQVAWAGSFEGRTTLGLGVRARLPFRVFVLEGPCDGSRVVIDVAHRW